MSAVATWTLIGYGLLLIIGGVLGYVLPEKPSKISLIAGGLTGIVSIVAFFVARSDARSGWIIGLVVGLLMETVMGMRLRKTKKFMPSGLLFAVSTLVVVIMALALFLQEQSSS